MKFIIIILLLVPCQLKAGFYATTNLIDLLNSNTWPSIDYSNHWIANEFRFYSEGCHWLSVYPTKNSTPKYTYEPEEVVIESLCRPIVLKTNNYWEIRFKTK